MPSKTIRQNALKTMRFSQIDALLDVCGLDFEIKNNGQHFVISGPKTVIDYWPGSGKFKVRGGDAGSFEWAGDFCAYCLKLNNMRQVDDNPQ